MLTWPTIKYITFGGWVKIDLKNVQWFWETVESNLQSASQCGCFRSWQMAFKQPIYCDLDILVCFAGLMPSGVYSCTVRHIHMVCKNPVVLSLEASQCWTPALSPTSETAPQMKLLSPLFRSFSVPPTSQALVASFCGPFRKPFGRTVRSHCWSREFAATWCEASDTDGAAGVWLNSVNRTSNGAMTGKLGSDCSDFRIQKCRTCIAIIAYTIIYTYSRNDTHIALRDHKMIQHV